MLWITAAASISYLIGSIPTAYIFARLLSGKDIREFGSGNVGATNALRLLGKGPGIIVLILDMLKGALPVIFLGGLITPKTNAPQELVFSVIALGCIFGHIWTAFLGFKGGKGVATTLGALTGLGFKVPGASFVLLLVILTWLLFFMLTRIVSLSSIAAIIAMPAYMFVFTKSSITLFFALILALIIILKHRENIRRLFQGKESRL